MDQLKPTRALIVQEATLAGATQILNPGFKGRNFITDTFVVYYRINQRDIELSLGTFLNDPVIGLTVLNDSKASKALFSLDELREALAAL